METFPSANPYDVRSMQNWKQIMGTRWWELVLPFNLQQRDGQNRMAEMTPAVAAALEESGLRTMDEAMKERWQKMQERQKGFWQLLACSWGAIADFCNLEAGEEGRHLMCDISGRWSFC